MCMYSFFHTNYGAELSMSTENKKLMAKIVKVKVIKPHGHVALPYTEKNGSTVNRSYLLLPQTYTILSVNRVEE